MQTKGQLRLRNIFRHSMSPERQEGCPRLRDLLFPPSISCLRYFTPPKSELVPTTQMPPSAIGQGAGPPVGNRDEKLRPFSQSRERNPSRVSSNARSSTVNCRSRFAHPSPQGWSGQDNSQQTEYPPSHSERTCCTPRQNSASAKFTSREMAVASALAASRARVSGLLKSSCRHWVQPSTSSAERTKPL